MTTPQIAIQARIWGLANLHQTYPDIFTKALQCGYAGVESRWSLLDDMEGLRTYMSTVPLKLVGLHANLKDFDPLADKRIGLQELLDKMNVLGTSYLLVSFGKQKEYGRWFELAGKLAETCAASQVTFCYHNHAGEFEYPSFFDELTGQYGVPLAADLAWVWRAGRDPVEFIDRYAPYIRYVHVKDSTSGGAWKELGQGDIDLPQALRRVSALNLPWWTVEQDDTDKDPTESATISRAYLRNHFGF
ncbi:sugar phosphate isomerase/epimerase [Paenibacillus hemerocallicola]|jgi:sugar phosphate isomerase/epimerase|uniref:Sugar phosphate isomerase/epimerase n=1 Tax=Paenibacillus hemerocallicola TaxID=1172614 RepID=A0A5C4TDL8_9BACL|nr:sugar phosphate isomerase/epimerase [Paenibacillus hemerocallicola]TNJ66995.1 sugar phosphate isomerase/epimerase [Paenibacillus hemerocallicola]